MARLAPIVLTRRLHAEESGDAIYLLQQYYAGPLGKSTGGFEGGHWDNFDPSGTRATSPDEFTPDDLLSASLLSAELPAGAVVRILGDPILMRSLSYGLHGLGDDRDLVLLSDDEIREIEQTSTIWRTLRSIDGLGPTRTSKLIARKRPRLIPIYDSVVGAAVCGDRTVGYWARMHAALAANDGELHDHLVSLREQAGLGNTVSPLRIFDVVAWLDASGKGDELLMLRDRKPERSPTSSPGSRELGVPR